MHVSAVEIQQQQQPLQPQIKKRRMDWESLDLNAGINTVGVEAKVLPHSFNAKDRDRNRKNPNGG